MRKRLIQTALRAAGQLVETQAHKSAPIQQLTHNLTSSNFTPHVNHEMNTNFYPQTNPVMHTNFIPIFTPNFIPTGLGMDPLAREIIQGVKREESKSTLLRDFEKYKEETLKEGEKHHVNNPIFFNNDQSKVDPVGDTKQKTNETSSAKKFTSAKALQDEVFKEAKEHIHDYKPLLMLFNVSEGTLKKTSMPLFEGIYAAFADKDGIPEDKAKMVVELAKWVVLAIITFVLYEYITKKLNEVKNLDAQAVSNYSQAEALYNKSILIAQECVRQLNSINELTKNKDLNEKLLNLLRECAESEEKDSVIGAGVNNLRAIVDSVINNKPLERSLLDGKIERKLQSLEEQDPLASMLLEKKGAKGYKGTENALQYQVDKFDNVIKHKKEGLELRQKEIQLKTDRIEELKNDTQKIEAKIEKNLFVKIGFFKPLHPNTIAKCDQYKEELKGIKIDKENDKEEDNNLRLSVD
ncbi:Uncharacterised protein [Legionella sainthelensi]|uniref:hypothetical protein n=1 Tax=Legionella sainthelensi TaxID=28087 RepID=UPI000E1FF315|nr:hypothetical protein [Legionella sainthelensi]VEB34727.1 Uncharacterised protein [Legionella sainthelensi]